MEFKIDTGANVTVIPEADYCKDQDGPLRISERSLTGAGQHPLHVCGQFLGCLKRKEVELQQEVYVVKGLRKPLLGRPAIEGLGVVSQIEQVHTKDIVKGFSHLFRGLA